MLTNTFIFTDHLNLPKGGIVIMIKFQYNMNPYIFRRIWFTIHSFLKEKFVCVLFVCVYCE